ncbi:MAG: DUF4870 domain-containing protein [Bacilli bacterium]|uniref:DUF4870 domain-containing protein n=1 Tax=Algoriella sp. TaxID=1872434 RepID=UPI002FC9B67D
MDNKILSIVSYISIVGWIIAYFVGKDKADDLLKYHLKQGFGLFIFSFIWGILISILAGVTGIGMIRILGLVNLILMIIGIINAANNVKKPLPIIGKMFENNFGFIG